MYMLKIFILICLIIIIFKLRIINNIEVFDTNKIITFIIPSIGRPTIARTILSLQKLNNPNWNAIVIFDNVKNNISYIKDSRIKYYEIKKTGSLNMGGSTRNYGINKVKNSEWIGFVDDDDTISPDYIDKLLLDSKYDSDCIIFRMISSNSILPPLNSTDIRKNKVGISFCVKKNVLQKNNFKNSRTEDFNLLYNLNKKYKILLSKNITYFVRMNPIKHIYKNIIGTELINPPIIS